MRTIQEMRQKHWSGVKSLWPAKKSTVAVPFCWKGFELNLTSMHLANIFAKNGSWNEANYWLTSAYSGTNNGAFWNQFI